MRDESTCRYDPVQLLISWLRMLAARHEANTDAVTPSPVDPST